MFVVVIDHHPPYLPPTPAELSLLTLPMGSGCVLDQVVNRVLQDDPGEILILPTFTPLPEYSSRLKASTAFSVKIITSGELVEKLKGAELAEMVAIVDSACWPITPIGIERLSEPENTYLGATYAVAVGADADRTRERVLRDSRGHVLRIERLYNRVSWPEAANSGVLFSWIPARSVGEVHFSSLAELRSALVARGVLTRDEPISTDLHDLMNEEGYLAANEHILTQSGESDSYLGFTQIQSGIFVGQQVRIHPTARLIPPIMIYPQTVLEQGVTLIGPSVIGTGSLLRSGSTIAQCVVAAETEVGQQVSIRRKVAAGTVLASDTEGLASSGRFDLPYRCIGGYHPGDDSLMTTRQPEKRNHPVQQSLKRAFDVFIAFITLVILAPLIFVIAALLRLESSGPIFFAHRRERRGGFDFPCFKFRTMVVNADQLQQSLAKQNEVDGPQFKMENDPRVTRIGRILRATNLDEIPQLWNVLLGHMSLVGPRPSPFRENQICVPWRRARLSVRPGITGLWQICRANRTDGDFNQWIYYDLAYVRHFSLWLDLKILIATVLTAGGKWRIPKSWLIPESHAARDLIETASAT